MDQNQLILLGTVHIDDEGLSKLERAIEEIHFNGSDSFIPGMIEAKVYRIIAITTPIEILIEASGLSLKILRSRRG